MKVPANSARGVYPDDELAKRISTAFARLMEESYLYRNQRIDLAGVLELLEDGVDTSEYDRLSRLRPWLPYSHNQGFTSRERQTLTLASVGVPAIGTPPEYIKTRFVIPTVHTWCSHCRDTTLHDSIPHIDCSPYHLNPEAVAEPLGFQNFLFNMQCQLCKSAPVTFMFRREFLKVQLTGRSHASFPRIPNVVPDQFQKILADADGAAACGDTFGAFYHLRTFLEHLMKCELGLAISDKVEGDELCNRYNKTIEPIVAERSSLTDVLDECARNLHNRSGSIEDYERVRTRILDHLTLKDALKKLPRVKSGKE